MIPRERLVLGTAKLGLSSYGYRSTSRPSAYDALNILRRAVEVGIQRFDTAYAYGDAMELLRAAHIPPRCWIVKARAPLPVRKLWRYEAALLHKQAQDTFIDWPSMHMGVSVYTVAEVAAARALLIAPIQAPASCLNPAVEVEYGRAPFLQGVLLRHYLLAPPLLINVVKQCQNLAAAADVSDIVLALHAAYGERLVFGVSSLAQLDAVLVACDQPTPPEEVIAAARALAATVDATAALPSLWSKP